MFPRQQQNSSTIILNQLCRSNSRILYNPQTPYFHSNVWIIGITRPVLNHHHRRSFQLAPEAPGPPEQPNSGFRLITPKALCQVRGSNGAKKVKEITIGNRQGEVKYMENGDLFCQCWNQSVSKINIVSVVDAPFPPSRHLRTSKRCRWIRFATYVLWMLLWSPKGCESSETRTYVGRKQALVTYKLSHRIRYNAPFGA